jgi:hypothetical protein
MEINIEKFLCDDYKFCFGVVHRRDEEKRKRGGDDIMLTTITTTTTTAVTMSQAAVFGAIGVVVLITLLIAKELSSASENRKALFLGGITSVTIHPLLFAFLMIVFVKVMEVL